MNTKRFIMIFFSLIFSLFLSENAFASDKISFSVNPILPKTQKNGIESYFDFKAVPNKTYHLELLVKNTSDHEMKINITPSNALTAKNGGIYYTSDWKTNENGLLNKKYSFKDHIKIQDTVILKPNSTKKIPLTVTSPNDKDGTYVGGLTFTPEEETTETVKQSNNLSFQIKNRQLLSIAIKLDMPEKEKIDFSFGKVTSSLSPSGIQLSTEMINNHATITVLNSFSFEVFDKNEKEILKKNFKSIKFAPNSYISFPVIWNEGEIKAGNYNVKLTANVDGKTITSIQKTVIKNRELDNYVKKSVKENKQIVIKETNHVPKWLWISLVITIPLLALIFFMLGRIKREK